MADPTLLILGGTTLAAAMAQVVSAGGISAIYSLAGRTQSKPVPSVALRSGGFGGPEKLASYLRDKNIHAVIDATHAYATGISSNAEIACQNTSTPLLRLQAPPWEPSTGDHWINASSMTEARNIAAGIAMRIFVTTGRQAMAGFADDTRCWWLARVIAPCDNLPQIATGQYIFARGPFDVVNEIALLRQHGISALISKNAGGCATYAKITAARTLGIPAIMVARPKAGGATIVTNVADAMAWLP